MNNGRQSKTRSKIKTNKIYADYGEYWMEPGCAYTSELCSALEQCKNVNGYILSKLK